MKTKKGARVLVARSLYHINDKVWERWAHGKAPVGKMAQSDSLLLHTRRPIEFDQVDERRRYTGHFIVIFRYSLVQSGERRRSSRRVS